MRNEEVEGATMLPGSNVLKTATHFYAKRSPGALLHSEHVIQKMLAVLANTSRSDMGGYLSAWLGLGEETKRGAQ